MKDQPMFTFLFSIVQAAQKTANATKTTIPLPRTPSYTTLQMFGQFLPFILIAVIFYLFIIKPQSQQRKRLTEMINNLKVGDKIITKGGLIGTVFKIQENTLILELHDRTKVEILKHAVISMLNGEK